MNKTVVIDCDSQGNYSVGEEPHETDAQEAAEQAGGGDNDDNIQMQPAKSLDDALKMAKSMFMASDGDGGQAAFEGGYAGVAGTPGSEDEDQTQGT